MAININFEHIKKKLEKSQHTDFKLFVGWKDTGMASIAHLHEYGGESPTPQDWIDHIKEKFHIQLLPTIHVPPRPHRYMVIKKFKNKWIKTLTKTLKNTNFDIEKSLNLLGLEIHQDYLDVLTSGDFHPLWWVTIEMRKFNGIGGDAPLYATGDMQRKLIYEVYAA